MTAFKPSKQALLTLAALAALLTSLAPPAAAGEKQARKTTRTSVSGNRGANVNQNVNRNTNVNQNRNVNVNRDININNDIDIDVDNDWHDHDNDWDDNPIARGVAFGAAAAVTAAVVGSIIYSLPPNCTTVVVNGFAYRQCGSTWYQPQYYGTQITYVVINPPR